MLNVKGRLVDLVRKALGIPCLEHKLNNIDGTLGSFCGTIKTLLNSQIFRSAIEDCDWLKYKSFVPGGWAMDNAGLYTLFRVINNMKPKRILEFGLGQSSLMIHQYTSFYNDAIALTIEHDTEWTEFFMKGIQGCIKIEVAQHDTEFVEYNSFRTLRYKNIEKFTDKWYDFFVVDGPFGSEHYSRSQIIDIVKAGLPDRFCIFIDDSDRCGEKETIGEICTVLANRKIEYHRAEYFGEKNQHAVLCSKDLKFLTSL